MGRTLFKEGRPGTGENWAEKLAAELAEMLGIPHSRYELAEWQGRAGVVTPSLVPEGARLIHGNELIGGKVTVADVDEKVRYYALRNHIASRIFQFLGQYADIVHVPPSFGGVDGVHSSLGVFVGYLLFDAWIANQDRHSENWAVIRTHTGIYLAPSYDHGSSLGRNETDERRQTMLTTKDQGSSLDAYVLRARSAIYPNAAGDAKVKAYLTSDLFQLAYRADPKAGKAWMERLGSIGDTDIQAVIAKVPPDLMSEVAREFTAKLLRKNIDRLMVLDVS